MPPIIGYIQRPLTSGSPMDADRQFPSEIPTSGTTRLVVVASTFKFSADWEHPHPHAVASLLIALQWNHKSTRI